ncbi:STAS domain-containing protein [Speluncibacter jeojiensis]|uniref:Anti-sigma factor antagonist n=1 Tax=Speluncibacter jeojiensis TaxID=2710754 RepID=A0A9X4LY63_9ACTN|nr:STAS domain-containing protein [Corynebacteriales bacterium D3-21]
MTTSGTRDQDGADSPAGTGPAARVTADGEARVVAPSGEIDIVVAPGLQRDIEAVLADRPRRIVIDLSAVTFLASAGLAMLTACRHSAGSEIAFAVVADGPATARPIELTGLSDELHVYPSLEAALQS